MQSRLLVLGNKYINSYLGLSASSWRGIALSLFESILVGVFYFLSIYFVNDLHLSVSSAGLIISACGAGSVLGGYAGGILSDRFSPIRISALALLIQGFAYLALLKIVIVPYLMVVAFVMGFASYVFITSNHLSVLQACMKDSNQKVKALNLISTSSNLGSGISGILLGYLLVFGFRDIFIVTALLLLVLGCGTYYLDSSSNKTVVETTKTAEQESADFCFDSMSLYLVLIAVSTVGMVVSQLGSSYPLYLQEKFHYMGMSSFSILFAINSFLVVLIANPVGEFCDRFNKLLMVGVGGFFICAGMFLLSVSGVYLIAMLACVIFTFGEVIFFSFAQFVCYHAGSSEKRGRNLGLFRTFYALSKIAGPLAGGYIYQRYGGDMVWYLSGMIGLFCSVLFAYAVARAQSLV